LVILFGGSVVGYAYYLKEKKEQLDSIKRGFCPQCHQKSIEISDERGGGCGPKLISFECKECGYQNSFSVENGSCGL
jgi:RNase P subunit RPR2